MTSQKSTSIPFYRDERVLRVIAQVVSTVIIVGLLIWAVLNFLQAAEARNMTLTFGFLKEAAGFPISNPPIEYGVSRSPISRELGLLPENLLFGFSCSRPWARANDWASILAINFC